MVSKKMPTLKGCKTCVHSHHQLQKGVVFAYLACFGTQVGTMISDVSRVLVVLFIIILAFATALACVGSEQVRFSFISEPCMAESLSRIRL